MSRLYESNDWFHRWMPYAIHRVSTSQHLWLPVNREYKPLGMTGPKWVDYEDHTEKAMLFARDPHHLDIWVGDPHETALYLYSDAPASRETYFDRLAVLMARVVYTTSSRRLFRSYAHAV